MRRVLLVVLLFTAAVVPTFSQTNNHPVKAAANPDPHAPAFRGFKLGMSVDEMLATFHDVTDIKTQLQKADGFPNFGLLQIRLSPADEAARERLKGLAGCWISFFDSHINAIYVSYPSFPEGADWANVDSLIMKFAEAFGLPEVSKWEVDPNSSHGKLLNGSGFQARVSITGGGSLEFHDTAKDVMQLVRERTAAYHEEKRRAFKP